MVYVGSVQIFTIIDCFMLSDNDAKRVLPEVKTETTS